MHEENRTPAALKLAVVLGGGLAVALGAAVGCGRADPRPNVLLVMIDTVRIDRMSVYGYERPTTPKLEALAAGGVVFEQAITHVPQTLPSAASLMTSLYPAGHGVRVNGRFALPEKVQTLAEVLGEHGYETAGIASSFPLDPRHGIAQGFDHYDAEFGDSVLTRERRATPFQGKAHLDFEQRADEATDKALAWLDERGPTDAPFFLFVHYFDPHFPYAPPPDVGLEGYDGEIQLVDRELDRLVRGVEKAAGAGKTLLVIFGDHGEILNPKRPGSRHAGYLREAVLRVPLILRHPSLPAGKRIPGQVALTDVAPTILAFTGIPEPPEFVGRNLLIDLEDGLDELGDPEELARSSWTPLETLFWKLEERSNDLERFGVRNEEYKYLLDIETRDGEESFVEKLFDLRVAGGDRRNLLDGDPLTRELRAILEMARRRTLRYREHGVRGEPLKLDAAAESKLRSLGYAGDTDSDTDD